MSACACIASPHHLHLPPVEVLPTSISMQQRCDEGYRTVRTCSTWLRVSLLGTCISLNGGAILGCIHLLGTTRREVAHRLIPDGVRVRFVEFDPLSLARALGSDFPGPLVLSHDQHTRQVIFLFPSPYIQTTAILLVGFTFRRIHFASDQCQP